MLVNKARLTTSAPESVLRLKYLADTHLCSVQCLANQRQKMAIHSKCWRYQIESIDFDWITKVQEDSGYFEEVHKKCKYGSKLMMNYMVLGHVSTQIYHRIISFNSQNVDKSQHHFPGNGQFFMMKHIIRTTKDACWLC